MSLYLCPRWRNKSDLFIYLLTENEVDPSSFSLSPRNIPVAHCLPVSSMH